MQGDQGICFVSKRSQDETGRSGDGWHEEKQDDSAEPKGTCALPVLIHLKDAEVDNRLWLSTPIAMGWGGGCDLSGELSG